MRVIITSVPDLSQLLVQLDQLSVCPGHPDPWQMPEKGSSLPLQVILQHMLIDMLLLK